MVQKRKNRPHPTSNGDETASSITSRIYRDALEEIRDEIRGLREGTREPPKKYDRIDRIAYLAKQASAFAAEERKATALEQKAIGAITKSTVLAWLRKLDIAERAQVIREAQEIDNRRSSLA